MSTNRRIYLDHNATAPLGPTARDAMVAALDVLGNPSSVHAEGRRARDLVERARDAIALLAGCGRESVVFTSGGTEANQLGLALLAPGARHRTIAVMAIEHPSLLGAARALLGWTVDTTADRPGLVAIGAVNHELGTVADLVVAAAAARAVGARIHVDAVQAAGRIALGPIVALADTVAISAHKLGGPQGVGALIVRDPDLVPVLDAGHQERGRRAGTENTVGIAGFGAAATAVDVVAWFGVAALGDVLEAGLLAIDGARINGTAQPRIGGTVNAAFAGARGESIVIALDLAGIAVSTGAACTSGSIAPSAVLLALGEPAARAREAVRFSLGRTTTRAQIDEVLRVLPAIVARARGDSQRRPREG